MRGGDPNPMQGQGVEEGGEVGMKEGRIRGTFLKGGSKGYGGKGMCNN